MQQAPQVSPRVQSGAADTHALLAAATMAEPSKIARVCATVTHARPASFIGFSVRGVLSGRPGIEMYSTGASEATGAGDEARTRDPYLGKVVLYH